MVLTVQQKIYYSSFRNKSWTKNETQMLNNLWICVRCYLNTAKNKHSYYHLRIRSTIAQRLWISYHTNTQCQVFDTIDTLMLNSTLAKRKINTTGTRQSTSHKYKTSGSYMIHGEQIQKVICKTEIMNNAKDGFNKCKSMNTSINTSMSTIPNTNINVGMRSTNSINRNNTNNGVCERAATIR